MCGICGALATRDGFAVGEDVVTRMREQIVHRGPDDGGTWAGHGVALGHRRLSITALPPAGHQPMSNEDGTVWITFGGEIYNHRALRQELERKGHSYRSETDTETIVHLYEEEGPHCVERLDGMFHDVIGDSRTRQLHLARDRLGKKPLYYAQPDGGFLFASEIKALLEHPALTAELDEEAFFHYLTFVCSPAPLTMFRGIRKLGPAQRLTVRGDGSTEVETYWSPFGSGVEGTDAGLARALARVAFRTGIGIPHAQAVEDASAGRLAFWGGAIAYHGELKEHVLRNGRGHPDSYRIVERLWHEAGERDLLQKMTYLELKNRL